MIGTNSGGRLWIERKKCALWVLVPLLFLYILTPAFAMAASSAGFSGGGGKQAGAMSQRPSAQGNTEAPGSAIPAHEVVLNGPKAETTLKPQSVGALGTTYFFDGFESGSVYTYWSVLDAYTWGASTRANYTGSYSAWCLGSSPYYDYPANMNARMIRGPYDLSGSSGQTALSAAVWLESETTYDRAQMLVSTDGVNYYGSEFSGFPGYWQAKNLDLTAVSGLGNVSRSSRLYVMLAFKSDGSYAAGEGVYFDDVTLKDNGTVVVQRPDLISSSVSGPSSAQSGAAIVIADTIYNQGNGGAAGFYASYYLSSDSNITSSDIYLGNRYVSSLGTGGANSTSSSFAVPAGMSGTYYVGAIVDSGGNVAESNEGNNSRAGNSVYVSSPDAVGAVIDNVTPNPVQRGSSVTLTGHGVDPTGHSLSAYQWRSSIDGVLSSRATFSTSSLSAGTHTIYFKTQCSNGTWSPEDSATLVVSAVQGESVTGSINFVTPSPATRGSRVDFSGYGTDSAGHGVSAYQWRSSIDGVLSSDDSFSTTTLSAGTHTIYFMARCDNGMWSPEVSTSFVVRLPTATVYSPVAPSAMIRGKAAVIYGYVAPRHSSGTYLVTLKFYKRNSNGSYAYHHSVKAKRFDYSSSKTKYKVSASIPHAGKWRVRAYHSCANHALSCGGYDYITVK